MALTLKEQYAIKTVPAYQAADGSKFHTLAEAQSFTREQMLKATVAASLKSNPQFAKLDPALLVEFLLLTGKHVGAVMAEALDAVPDLYAAAAQAVMPKAVNIEVTGTMSREQAERGLKERLDTARVVPASDKPKWDEHPLRKAMANVDDEMERQIEDDVASAMRLGGHG